MGPDLNVSGGGFLAVLLVLWALAVTIFWMVVGWRAMKAHEQIAKNTGALADRALIQGKFEEKK